MRQRKLLHQSSSIFSSGEMTSPFACSSARRNATPTCTTIQKKHQWIKWKLCTKNGEGIGENWCWSFFFTWQKRVIRVFLTAAEELTPHPSNPFEPSKNPTMPCLRKHIVSDPTSKDPSKWNRKHFCVHLPVKKFHIHVVMNWPRERSSNLCEIIASFLKSKNSPTSIIPPCTFLITFCILVFAVITELSRRHIINAAAKIEINPGCCCVKQRNPIPKFHQKINQTLITEERFCGSHLYCSHKLPRRQFQGESYFVRTWTELHLQIGLIAAASAATISKIIKNPAISTWK